MKPALRPAGLLEDSRPLTSMEDNGAERRRKRWLIEESRVYRQTMAMLWG